MKKSLQVLSIVLILGVLGAAFPAGWLLSPEPAQASIVDVTVAVGNSGVGQRNVSESPITFPDPNMEAAIRQAINKPTGDIFPSDLTSLTNLNASSKGISNLTGLNYCTALQTLNLMQNQISDLSPLSGLTSLTELYLGYNQISNLSPLSGLSNLTQLLLRGNQISDVSSLSGITSLTSLDLSGNQISDLSPLSGLASLTSLAIVSNQISDVSPLSGLTSLTSLGLGSNQISNLSPLSGLTNLTNLILSSNQISDISSLAGLIHLTQLLIYGNQINDLSPLSGLTSLTSLDLSSNQISDLLLLSGLTNLIVLHLDSNQIIDISPLLANTGLGFGDFVTLQSNPLSEDSLDVYIPQLQARGVGVIYDVVVITPAGSNVMVDFGNGRSVRFENVTSPGITTLTPSAIPLMANFAAVTGSCYDISTTATFSGNVLISLPYDQTRVTVLESQLSMLHYEGGVWVDAWVDVTVSVDTVNNTITGQATSLSPFVVAQPLQSTPPVPELATIALMGTGLLALGGLVWLRRRKVTAHRVS